MNAQQIRQAYLDFFKSKQHQIIKRAPLILTDDPTTLFTGSGMQPLLPYLLGQPHAKGQRLTDSQTCFRSQDIDDVGDNRHTTFFEMLGNWSLGDYFKEQQIRWFFEFLTKEVGLDPNKLYVSCFIGDEANNIPKDEQAAQIWQQVFAEAGIEAKIVELGSAENGDKLGMQGGRIFYYDDGENWWSRGGGINKTPIGDPCGPDSEVFYDFGEANHDANYGQAHPASDSGRFMEIGNQVFMQYKRLEDGSFAELDHKNVDFGGGLERIAATKLDSPDVFQISLLKPIIDQLEKISGKKYTDNLVAMRVIADHLRSATFLAIDGCVPSNKEQGYVMRKLIRRAMVKAFDLGIENNFFASITPTVLDLYQADFVEAKDKYDQVIAVLVKEEKVFRQTLRKGLREFDKLVANRELNFGQIIFKLYDTYGFPVELSLEQFAKRDINLPSDWQAQFDQQMEAQKQRSQTASKGRFKGGLEGSTDQQRRLHTAAHLMLAAMKQVLGPEASQKGSHINDERLRFDVNYPEKINSEQIKQIEDLVNQAIANKLPVSYQEMPTDEAFELGAAGEFRERYGDVVKVYSMGEGDQRFSFEICGGPHVNNTSELSPNGEQFKIIKEKSSSAGVRRIKAVLK